MKSNSSQPVFVGIVAGARVARLAITAELD
jgi:hypothetical protein